jgi:hypothetical protein
LFTLIAFRFALMLLVAFTLATALPHAQSERNPDLETFLNGCSSACLMGIEPGTTTLREARGLMRRSDWVASYAFSRVVSNSGFLRWTWSSAHPDAVNPSVDGKVWISEGVVEWIEVATRFAYGDLWQREAPPQSLAFRVMSGQTLVYQADYGWLRAEFLLACPARADRFWRSPVTLRLQRTDHEVTLDPIDPLHDWRGCR